MICSQLLSASVCHIKSLLAQVGADAQVPFSVVRFSGHSLFFVRYNQLSVTYFSVHEWCPSTDRLLYTSS